MCVNAKISHALATLRFFFLHTLCYAPLANVCECVVCVCACDERENKRHYSFIGILIASSFIFYFLCTPTGRVHASTPPYTSFYIAFIIMYFLFEKEKKARSESRECCCRICRGVKLYCSASPPAPTASLKDHERLMFVK